MEESTQAADQDRRHRIPSKALKVTVGELVEQRR
jgi:hypothetical protein